jgi:hypothetical protein
MNEQEILAPDSVSVMVADRAYTIHKLTLIQIIKMGKLLGKSVLSSRAKLKQLAEATKDSSSNANDFMSILELLEEDDIISLFCIILAEKNPEYLKTKLTFEASVEIIKVVAEQNGIEGIKRNFQSLGELIGKSSKKKGS